MPISSSVTITKKIIFLNIDVENLRVVFTIRERTTDSLEQKIAESFKDVVVSGTDFVTMINTIGDGTKNLYNNIADISYAYLQANGHV